MNFSKQSTAKKCFLTSPQDNLLHQLQIYAPKQHFRNFFGTPGRKVDTGLTRPFLDILCKQKQSKSNKHKTNTKKKNNNKKNKNTKEGQG